MALAFHPEPQLQAQPLAPRRPHAATSSQPMFRPGTPKPSTRPASRVATWAPRQATVGVVSPVARVSRPGSSLDQVYVRRRVAVGVLAFVFCCGLWFLGSGIASIAGASSPSEIPVLSIAPQETHVVQPGDTLWSIASDLEIDGDLRPIVDQIAALNGGDAVLQPGQRLMIPAYHSLSDG